MKDIPEVEIDVEEIGELQFIDPLNTAGEIAAIIGTIADSDIADMGAKQACIDDCLHIIYRCNVILKAQLKEQYPIYFETKKKKENENADTKISAKNGAERVK